jgi:inosose dehydratase
VLKLYAKRIIELHLRQSKDGIWTETFTAEGDIDYRRLANEIKKNGISPHLVIEQAVEAQTPHTIEAVEAHKKDLAIVKDIFSH